MVVKEIFSFSHSYLRILCWLFGAVNLSLTWMVDNYRPGCNALYIRLKRGKVAESEQISNNLILDINKRGEIIGIEVPGPKPIDMTKISRPIRIITKSIRRLSHARNISHLLLKYAFLGFHNNKHNVSFGSQP